MAEQALITSAQSRRRALAGGALMLVGGMVAMVSFFLPWVISTPMHPESGQPSFATSLWTLVKMGGVDLVFFLLLAAEAAVAITGGQELAGRHGPLPPAGVAILCVPGLLATVFLGWITMITANLTAPYLVSTSISVGPWLTFLSLLAALAGAVAASTGEGSAATPAPLS